MNITPTAHNNRIKYAWYRWRGLPSSAAKRLSQHIAMPPEFYVDLDRWFYYQQGQLKLDPTNGQDNSKAQKLENFAKTNLKDH